MIYLLTLYNIEQFLHVSEKTTTTAINKRRLLLKVSSKIIISCQELIFLEFAKKQSI